MAFLQVSVVGAQDVCGNLQGEQAIQKGMELVDDGACYQAVSCYERGAADRSVRAETRGMALYSTVECYDDLGRPETAMMRLAEALPLVGEVDEATVRTEWQKRAERAIRRAASTGTSTSCKWIRDSMEPFLAFGEVLPHFLLGRCLEHGDPASALTELKFAYGHPASEKTPEMRAVLRRVTLKAADVSGAEGESCELAEAALDLEPDVEEKAKAEAIVARTCPRPEEVPVSPAAGEGPTDSEQVGDAAGRDLEPEPISEWNESSGFGFGAVLAIGAGLAFAAAGVTAVMALMADDDLDELCPERKCSIVDVEEADAVSSRIDTLAIATDVLLASGAVMGILALAVGGGGDERGTADAPGPALRLACGPHACGGAVRARF